MLDLTDESTAIAHALVNDAQHLLTIVSTRSDRTPHGTVVQLRREIGFADRRLAALRRGLLHDLEVRLQPPRQQAEEQVPNPYRLVQVGGADEQEEFSRLSDEDLLEQTRYYHWWYSHEPNPLQGWNVSKRFSALRNEAVDRGYRHDAWMDGTEEEEVEET